jgi:histidyl-tRNA synthetase
MSTTEERIKQLEQELAQLRFQQEQQSKSKNRGKGGMISLDPIAGTRDFPPEDMRLRNWLFSRFHSVARSFGFEEYDAPILESEELYKRKAGEEITQQMYNFKDKSDQAVALRPEMTPTLARLILQQGKALLLPVKWYSIPQCWRYETTTRGRKREHYQWNMDIWGIQQPSAEAELLAAIVALFESVGLTKADVGIKVSSRKVLQSVLDKLGVQKEVFAQTCIIIDKLDKLEREEVIRQLNQLGLDNNVAEQILKNTTLKSIDELEEFLGAGHEAVKELKTLFSLAKGYGYEDWLIFDASIVRGLAYYTGIVFEAFARQGELQRAICGGGRYDRILSTYGSKNDVPACGFGFGDCVILEILKDKKLIPANITKHFINDLVIPFNEEMRSAACDIVTKLRKAGRVADVYLGNTKKIKTAFSYADRIGADRAIFIAPEEWKDAKVNIKYLRLGSTNEDVQYTVPINEILTFQPPQQ